MSTISEKVTGIYATHHLQVATEYLQATIMDMVDGCCCMLLLLEMVSWLAIS